MCRWLSSLQCRSRKAWRSHLSAVSKWRGFQAAEIRPTILSHVAKMHIRSYSSMPASAKNVSESSDRHFFRHPSWRGSILPPEEDHMSPAERGFRAVPFSARRKSGNVKFKAETMELPLQFPPTARYFSAGRRTWKGCRSRRKLTSWLLSCSLEAWYLSSSFFLLC